MTARLVVLASGSGTNLQAIIDACVDRRLNAEVVHVVVDRDAAALQRARRAGITGECRLLSSYSERHSGRLEARAAYDAALADAVMARRPDLVVLAGWMHLLSSAFLDVVGGRVVNLHPALPGTFPGANAIDDAWAAHQNRGLDHTGVMVHFVPDEGVDNGPVVASRRVDIFESDTRASLEKRIHDVEHDVLVSAISELITGVQ